jgi:hypothetical protein
LPLVCSRIFFLLAFDATAFTDLGILTSFYEWLAFRFSGNFMG